MNPGQAAGPPRTLRTLPTLIDALERAARDETVGLRFVDRREQERFFPWPEISRRARLLADRLRLRELRGVGPGARVALVYPTSPEFVVAFFAALSAGAVAVPLAPPLRLGRMEEYGAQLQASLAAARPALLLAEPSLVAALAPLAAAAACPVRSLDDLMQGGEDPTTLAEPAEVSPEDLAVLQFSSGTTAAPKPVALSHRALLEQVRILNEMWPDREGVRHSGVSWLPLYHDMGLVGFLLSALWRPATLTLLQPEVFAARPALWLRAIGRHRATVSAAPSFAYALCVEKVSDEEMEGVDLAGWTIALNGAENVAAATIDSFCARFARWGFRRAAMTPVYGMAEAALALTFSPLGSAPKAISFARHSLEQGTARPARDGEPAVALVGVGQALAGMAVEIRDPGASEVVLDEGRVGVVFARSPSLMTGYFGQPEATRAVLRRGWLDTGDRGFLWEGALFLAGRTKDLIIVRGRNVAPETIEQAVALIAGVRPDGVAAVSAPPESGSGNGSESGGEGEAVALFVERDRQTAPAEEERIAAQAADAALAAAGVVPARVVVLASGSLPRTSSGKVRRQEALRRWREGALDRRAG